ncbi:MAG: GIY-YIG nuclease family protein [Selenomonadaceae bacterium]|nr:GIY-YIG nuclease family protein [Selenomonadaceae bacterium]
MSNGATKVGVTDNLPRRIKEIKAETNLEVLQFKTTIYMPREEAVALETAIKNYFADRCIGGEFFSVRFAEVIALF